MKPNILVIEDDKSYGEYLKKTLIDEGYEVTLSKSGIKSLQKLENKKADLIISGYYLPNIRGDEFLKQLRKMYSNVPIIFISHETQKEAIKNVLAYPKADYITKPVVKDELMARIENSLEESKKVGGKKTIKVGDLVLDLETFKARRGDKDIELAPTEFSLLKYMMLNKGSVLTRDMILSRIWGYNSDVSSRVVDVYVGYLRDKIDKGAEKKLIKTVRGFGYKIED